MSRRPDDLVKVASAGNQALAELWREVLDNNGIPSQAAWIRLTP